MASSKLIASSTSWYSDLKRKLSPRASTSSATDFLLIDSSSNARDNLVFDSVMVEGFPRNAYAEINLGLDQSHRLGAEAESSSGALLTAEITLLDAAGAITPISDGELEPRRVVRKTVDDVWREIVAGKKSEKQPKEEMMTLEDFLVKAGAVEETALATIDVLKVKEEQSSGGIYVYESKSDVIGSEAAVGMDIGDMGRRRGKRSLSLLQPLDKVAQQRQRRMIKNRESAARSRERKQVGEFSLVFHWLVSSYGEVTDDLFSFSWCGFVVIVLGVSSGVGVDGGETGKRKRAIAKREGEGEAEHMKKRLKQLMENVIPVVEKRKPPRLRRVRSLPW
ncbi:hypothetical protein OROGR_021536 [Orobanche gracilis]